MGDMSLPADYPTVPASVYDDVRLVKLAREIAMGLKDIPDILFDNSLTQREFDEIQSIPHFARILSSEMAAWASAGNTTERVKLKTVSMIEELLPELYARLNDPGEPLHAKVKAFEQLCKVAGFGEKDLPAMGSPGDRVQVIINLGADTKLQYEKRLPQKVIDVTPEKSFTESLDAASPDKV
jgi:hypothetical protein